MSSCKVLLFLVASFVVLVLEGFAFSITNQDKVTLPENSSASRFFTEDLLQTSRKKKKGGKFLLPILFGALMIKSIIFPLAFKAMAVMSSIAVLLSTMSLIISSIVGYVKLAIKPNHPSVKVVHVNDNYPLTWAKDDDAVKNYGMETVDYDPNQVYSSPYIK